MIDEVARLKELAVRRRAITERQHETGNPNHAMLERLDIEHDIMDAVPKLLDALGEIRSGDAEILGLFVEFMEKHKPDGHLNDTGPGREITNAKTAACLRRYRDLARKMEGKL